MEQSDKNLVKKSAIIILDEIASSIPLLKIAWELSKALYSGGIELRKARALEWLISIRENPDIFTEEVLNSELFQDGFVYSLEKYLRERSEEKRRYFRNIFFDFATAKDFESFPLEKLLATLEELSPADIAVLRDVDPTQDGELYQIYNGNPDTASLVDNIFNLVHSGILRQETTAKWAREGEKFPEPFVKMSHFGKEFITYISDLTNQPVI